LIKSKLTKTPILISSDWNKEFHVHCDASNEAIGSVLVQNINGKTDSPIFYASRLLNQAERNYSTIEREALAMVYSLHKFFHYLLANHFIFYVDHEVLIHLVNRTIVSGRIARWMLLLQEYDFEIVHKPGRQHVVADHLSRISNGEAAIGIPDSFSDASLFMVQVTSQQDEIFPFYDWRRPIIDYLQTGRIPMDIPLNIRCQIAIRS